jgi:nucleotide-binding universal stress UspA family protein
MIAEEVDKLKIDLLILGNHKRGMLYEAFIGHTAEKILREIEIPVLIVPLKEK